MNKKIKWFLVALTLVAVLVAAFAGVVLADSPEDGATAPYCGYGGWGHQEVCSDAVVDLLGLSHEEIAAQRLEGKSLAEIAAAQGVSEEALVSAILAARQEVLQDRVTAGTLTQEQADRMLQEMEERTMEAVNRTGVGSNGFGRGQGCGFGGARQWANQGNQAPTGAPGYGMMGGGMSRWGGSFR